MAILKVETDIIVSITASLIGKTCDISDNVCQDIYNWRDCFYISQCVGLHTDGQVSASGVSPYHSVLS